MSKSTSQRSAAAIVNNSAQPTSPRSPLHGSASVFDRRGARAKSSKLAPLLVLAGFRTHKQLTKNKSHQVTPFWHKDTRPRVTVTFGARRPRKTAAALKILGVNGVIGVSLSSD